MNAPVPSLAPAPASGPATPNTSANRKADANALLKKKMHTAVLTGKRIFAGGRMGVFTLRPTDGERCWFEAGQYVTLGLDTPDGFVPRPYSFAGSPLDGGFEFFVALVEGGKLTPTFFRQEVGATFHYLSPKGRFTLRNAGKPTVVMVATGTGLAPFVSQIRSLWKLHRSGVRVPHRIVLFHGCAHADEFGYREELLTYAAAREDGFDLTCVFTASRPDPARHWSPQIGKGRVNELVRLVLGQPVNATREVALPEGQTADGLRALIDPAQTAVLACGNPGMLEDIKEPIAHTGIATYLVEEYWKA